MIQHNHSQYIDGCLRCELGLNEFVLFCECCLRERVKLPFESRNGVLYCQECWDEGCDLQSCSLPSVKP